MDRICPLNSGSNGNATYIEAGDEAMLIDAGLSRKRIVERIEEVGGDISRVKGIVITHEHTDHTRGLTVLLKHHQIPVYATTGTFRAMKTPLPTDTVCRIISAGVHFEVGPFHLMPRRTYHDAAESIFLEVSSENKILAYITDTGFVTEEMKDALKSSSVIFLESNFDPLMLEEGNYPYFLKERIKSRHGHLSNLDAASILSEVVNRNTKFIFLGHLSENNNLPDTAYRCARKVVDEDVPLTVASRFGITEPYRF